MWCTTRRMIVERYLVTNNKKRTLIKVLIVNFRIMIRTKIKME